MNEIKEITTQEYERQIILINDYIDETFDKVANQIDPRMFMAMIATMVDRRIYGHGGSIDDVQEFYDLLKTTARDVYDALGPLK